MNFGWTIAQREERQKPEKFGLTKGRHMDPLKEMKQIYMRTKKDIPISADFSSL